MQADAVPTSAAPIHFLRLPAVCARTGLSRTHIHRLEAAGKFPRRIKLSPAASAWIESEIDAWASARVAASRGDDA
jgi:predicted DNA-binding transcriptional regulator AlpA